MQQVILEQLQTLRNEQRQGFDSIRSEFNQRIDRLVTNEAFAAEQRRVDDKFGSLGREIGEERGARKQSFEKLAVNVRWLAASLVVPIGLFIVNLVAFGIGAS